MSKHLKQLQTTVCDTLCESAEVHDRPDGTFVVTTPFSFPDGDRYMLYLKPLPAGGYRISDMGHTLMHISYEMDVDKLKEGNRGKLFSRVLAECGVQEDDGEVYMEVPRNQVGDGLFRLGQTVTRLHDITFLNRFRVESTFYEDLLERIAQVVPEGSVERGYVVPGIQDAENYEVDYFVPGKDRDLFIYGVSNKDKAQFTTIALQYFNQNEVDYDSILVFEDQQKIPSKVLARLSNAGGEQVASLDAREELIRKIKKRAKAA
jgi:hypothetical protein